jgi:hypothetical protein
MAFKPKGPNCHEITCGTPDLDLRIESTAVRMIVILLR